LIADVLLPKYLPEVTPSEFNYPIYGKWHGNKYRFITRYRSDQPSSFTPEFEAPFARLGGEQRRVSHRNERPGGYARAGQP
jgi:hypothetical protein